MRVGAQGASTADGCALGDQDRAEPRAIPPFDGIGSHSVAQVGRGLQRHPGIATSGERDDSSGLHHEARRLETSEISERIAIDQDEIRSLARRHRPDLGVKTQ